jgi:Ca-activated chloride channel family protein
MIFLRPEWLLLLLFWVPIVIWQVRSQRVTAWHKVMDASLIKALALDSSIKFPMSRYLLITILLLGNIALSGPALTHSKQKTASQGNLFVVLDTSLSMAATDVAPNRITRAKRMIADWSRSGLFDKISVIAYSASAHTLTPLTSDVNTLELQLQSLSPFIMPEFGNRAELAFEHLQETIQSNAYEEPHILWITDDVNPNKINDIKKHLPAFISATVVPMGTQAGSPIPLPNDQGFLTQGDSIVIVKTDINSINSLSSNLGFRSVSLNQQPDASFFESLKHQSNQPIGTKDIGYWLLIPLVLFWLIRTRHVAGPTSLALLLYFGASDPTHAASWFKNSEQQAYELLQSNPEQAVATSNLPSTQGQALFQLERFEESAEVLSQETNVDALYNRANALAHAGKLQEAVSAYDAVLKLSEHAQANKNKELIEEFLENQPSNSGEQDGEQQESSEENESQDSESNQNQKSDESQESDSSSEESDGSDNEEQSEPSPSESEEEQTTKEDEIEQTRSDQEADAILNQLQNPTGSVLQQKFRYQYQQNPTETDGTLW